MIWDLWDGPVHRRTLHRATGQAVSITAFVLYVPRRTHPFSRRPERGQQQALSVGTSHNLPLPVGEKHERIVWPPPPAFQTERNVKPERAPSN